MTVEAKRANNTPRVRVAQAREQVAERVRRLYAEDEQFRNAQPDLALQDAARRPGLRLPQICRRSLRAMRIARHWAGGRAR